MTEKTCVIYNGRCPVCAHEIAFYARRAQTRSLPIRFDDLNNMDLAPLGLSQDAAARRLHVITNGQLLSGVDAFVALWREMPGFAWAARLVSLPFIYPLACLTYDHVIAPALYRRFLRRNALATPSNGR